MNTNDNKEGAKSNIDKIREDLEKKLAALEKAKLSSKDEESESINNIDEVIKEEEFEQITSEENENNEKKSFLDHLTNIEEDTTTEDQVEGVPEEEETTLELSDEETLFEISDEINDIEQEESQPEEDVAIVSTIEEVKKEIDSNKIDFDKIEGDSNKNEVIPPPITTESDVEDDLVEENIDEIDEEEKKSKLGFLMYGLIGILVLAVGYFVMDYLKGKDKLIEDVTNKKITELENRRYQDSIRLLEAEKRLAEFESQKYIDSIAQADRLQLKVSEIVRENALSKKNKTIAKKEKSSYTPTTTIYKNNKPVATSSRDLVFEDSGKKDNVNDVIENSVVGDNTKTDKNDLTNVKAEEVKPKTKEDEVVAKEIKKEKKIETLNTIEQAPVYPGCEGKSTESAKKKCMITNINKFVNSKFNTYVAQDIGLDSGLQKIWVSFIIDKNGYANVTRTRAKHEALKKEALRVVSKLPKMKPAMKNGKRVDILYNLPIMIKIEN